MINFYMPPHYRTKHGGSVHTLPQIRDLKQLEATPGKILIRVGDTFLLRGKVRSTIKGRAVKPIYSAFFTHDEEGNIYSFTVYNITDEAIVNSFPKEVDLATLSLVPKENVCQAKLIGFRQNCGAWTTRCWVNPKQRYPFASLLGPNCTTWI